MSAARPAATGEHLLQFDCVFFNKEQNRAWRVVWFAAAWTIWLGRNSAIFRGVEFEPAKAFELLRLRAWKWLRAREVCFKASLYDWKIHPAIKFMRLARRPYDRRFSMGVLLVAVFHSDLLF